MYMFALNPDILRSIYSRSLHAPLLIKLAQLLGKILVKRTKGRKCITRTGILHITQLKPLPLT